MRLEIIIIAITAFFLYNLYYDGKFLKKIYTYKKYFTMGIVIILAVAMYLLIKRDPIQSKKILLYANNMVKYMPIDKQSMNLISPIIDFTIPKNNENGFMLDMNRSLHKTPTMRGGTTTTKRSVSETKKKYVASQQNWRCEQCQSQLNHTYEIDHRVRLEYGGSNNVENLVALCRNCHGVKTARENM